MCKCRVYKVRLIRQHTPTPPIGGALLLETTVVVNVRGETQRDTCCGMISIFLWGGGGGFVKVKTIRFIEYL